MFDVIEIMERGRPRPQHCSPHLHLVSARRDVPVASKFVAQVSNLPYRRLPVGRALAISGTSSDRPGVRHPCGAFQNVGSRIMLN